MIGRAAAAARRLASRRPTTLRAFSAEPAPSSRWVASGGAFPFSPNRDDDGPIGGAPTPIALPEPAPALFDDPATALAFASARALPPLFPDPAAALAAARTRRRSHSDDGDDGAPVAGAIALTEDGDEDVAVAVAA